jgi:hypothetical protein
MGKIMKITRAAAKINKVMAHEILEFYSVNHISDK